MQKFSKIIYFLPRILSIIFILFLSIFSFDVFGENIGFFQAILAFFIHSLPSIFLILITIIAWKFDLVGAITFFSAGILYILLVGFNRPWSWYAFISGPAFFVGILFFLSWLQRRKKSK